MNITLISGSQNPNSQTYRVILHLTEQIKNHFPEANLQLIDVRKYNIPLDAEVYKNDGSAPKELQTLIDIYFNSDCFILVSPEYNGSYTPALKNLLNHFPGLKHKPVGIVSSTDGRLGGMRAAQQMQLMVVAHFGVPLATMLIISEVHRKFDHIGNLLDPHFEKAIHHFLNEFAWITGQIIK